MKFAVFKLKIMQHIYHRAHRYGISGKLQQTRRGTHPEQQSPSWTVSSRE